MGEGSLSEHDYRDLLLDYHAYNTVITPRLLQL